MDNNSQPGVTSFKFYANSENIGTKATLTPNEEETSFAAAWEDGDEMVIESLSLNPEFDGFGTAVWNSSERVFNATYDESDTLPSGSGDWTYSAWYPAKANVPFQSNRVQNGNAYNSGYDLMYGSVEVNGAQIGKNANGTSLVIPMNRLTAIAYYHITSNLDEDVVSATLTVDEGKTIAAESVEISVDGKTITPTNGSNTITITFEDGTAPKATDFQLWFNILTENIGSASSYNVTVDIVTTGHTAKLTSKSARSFTAGKLNRAKISSLTWNSSAVAAGTVLFDEPFTGFDADDVPSAPGDKATVFGLSSVSYKCDNGSTDTKIYAENTAGGQSPELLVSKNNGQLAISGIPTGFNEKITVTWNSNNTNIKLYYNDGAATATLIGEKHYQAVLDVTGASIGIVFKNTTSSNGRLDNIHIVAGEPVVLEKVAAPTFSPAGGSYASAQSVTISCETSGATIYFTTGSSEYSAGDWTQYTAPVEITSTSTIKAIAVKDGMADSEVVSSTYVISSGYYYTKVTSVDKIVSGEQYVIVGSTGEKNYALPTNPSLSSGKITGTEISISSNGISDLDVAGLLWTLTKSGDNYSLSDGSNYLYHSNGGNSGTNLGYGPIASYLWNITIPSGEANGTFQFAGVDNGSVKTRGMLVTSDGTYGGYSLSNIANAGYCGIDLYALSDGKTNAEVALSYSGGAITFGDDPVSLSLTNPHGVVITCSTEPSGVVSVTNEGVATIIGAGTATITASWEEQTIGEITYRKGSVSYQLTVNKKSPTIGVFNNPTTTVAVNGSVTNKTTISDGLTITYTSSDESVATVTNEGVVTGLKDGTATISATFDGNDNYNAATPQSYTIKVGNVTLTDILNRGFTGVTNGSSNYSSWSKKTTGVSEAEYAGNSAGGNNAIQLRSNNNNSGVVSTKSGGKVKKIVVTWESNTANGRTLNVYGKNSTYSAATDLYDNTKQGTLLGTIVCGTSTELTITGDYSYIGFRSASGAMYLSEVKITWE